MTSIEVKAFTNTASNNKHASKMAAREVMLQMFMGNFPMGLPTHDKFDRSPREEASILL